MSEDLEYVGPLVLSIEGAHVIKRAVFKSGDHTALFSVGLLYSTLSVLSSAMAVIERHELMEELDDEVAAMSSLAQDIKDGRVS